MSINGRVNKEWAIRMLLIGVMFLAYGGWCIYDGAVAYPRAIQKFELTHRVEADGSAVPLDNWRAILEDNGYTAGEAPPRGKSETDILTQWIQAGLCFPLALLILGHWAYHARRTPSLDESGLRFAGRTVPFSDITKLDKTRWFNKDICLVHYDGPAGAGRFNLDGWKYRGAHEILEQIEQQAPQAEIELKHEDQNT